ncbi:MFS transporter [Cohnella nanjingensis]|uniref:MFS transporter n=1 Tax=Cohnella nanjingensis TaxID=1387779 RepID=A0A7X0RVV5_9BACL|nr:MFS transporter [Cohnella nanjingensis]MBB6674555.1 MFS transporter [Cohnella nanjingensis]
MSALFRNPNFTRMFLATVASQLGTIVGNMAFAFYLLDRFSSQPGYASLAELMYSLPTLFVFWAVGVVADRFDRQRIAEHAGWIRVGLTVVLIATLTAGWLPAAFAVLFLRSAVSKFYYPAESAMLQGILKPDQYEQASGLNQTVMGVFTLLSVGIGAAAYHTIGIIGAVATDGIGLALSAWLIRSCRISQEVRLPNGKSSWRTIRFREVRNDFTEGLGYIQRKPLLLALVSGFLLFGLLNGGFAVLPLYTMKYKLAPDHYTFFSSLFAVFFGIGMLLGSIVGAAIVKKWRPHLVIPAGLLATSLLGLVLLSATDPWMYLGTILVIGFTMAPVNVAIGGWMPSLVDPRQMGRVSAWNDPLLMLGQSVALGLIAWLYPHAMSLSFIYVSLSVILFLSFFFYAGTLPRLQRKALAEGAAGSQSSVSSAM